MRSNPDQTLSEYRAAMRPRSSAKIGRHAERPFDYVSACHTVTVTTDDAGRTVTTDDAGHTVRTMPAFSDVQLAACRTCGPRGAGYANMLREESLAIADQ